MNQQSVNVSRVQRIFNATTHVGKPTVFFTRQYFALSTSIMLFFLTVMMQTIAFASTAPSVSNLAATNNAANSAIYVTDEPFALYEGLVRELRRGGYVIYMRHGVIQPGNNDQRSGNNWWSNCTTTQRTGQAALPNAQAITAAIIKHQIKISDIQTSEFCRAYDTGVFLGLVAPIRNPALNDISAFVSQKRNVGDLAGGIVALLSTPPAQGQNRILIGHTLPPTIVHPLLAHVQPGHTVIFKPEGDGRFHFVATLSPGQWQLISKKVINDAAQLTVQNSVPQANAQVVQPAAPPTPAPPYD